MIAFRSHELIPGYFEVAEAGLCGIHSGPASPPRPSALRPAGGGGVREPRAQLLDISARRGRRCVPSAVAAGQVALSRRRGAISCFHFYFLKPPSNPLHACPNHSKERSSITFEHSCQMHIVFLRILFVLAASFLAAISLANSWGMFVQHKLGPCDLISSSRPYNVNNNP